ncbi:GATA transcription factor 26-like [Abrus precatorius]|uniref:GATA transcription factor 26-like n=1 Tax=Abrus precatorius TaxID=3816 RepID=A0A8B8KX17_ABRPR|nr:GATA transcription factor 26-like [Abrus precatorius]
MVSPGTPLWRNGPEEKPVLCNACGSRYRIWGSLDDYLPKHFQPEHLSNLEKLMPGSSLNVKNIIPSSDDPDSDEKDSSLWNPKVPSKKRSRVVYERITPMKRFHKRLLSMWKHGKPNESSPEEVLLYHNVNNFIPSGEIGLGAVLLKPDGTST